MSRPDGDLLDDDSDLDAGSVDFDDNAPHDSTVKAQWSSAEDKEREDWNSQRFSAKFTKVMELLKGERRWDETCGSSGTPVLEDYKKDAMLAESDQMDTMNPTFFQSLARFTEEFALVPHDLCMAMIRSVLKRRVGTSAAGSVPKAEATGQPALNLAIKFDNDKFIDCLMECCPDDLDDLIRMQDSDGKNCLHLIFAPLNTLKLWRSETLKGPQEKALRRCEKLIPKAKPASLAAKDSDGNTPIHLAMHCWQCHLQGENYVELVKDMVLRGDKADTMKASGGPLNNRNQSPILYFRHSMERVKEVKRRRQEKASSQASSAKQSSKDQPTSSNKNERDPRDQQSREGVSQNAQDLRKDMAVDRTKSAPHTGPDRALTVKKAILDTTFNPTIHRVNSFKPPKSPAPASVADDRLVKARESKPQEKQEDKSWCYKTLIEFLTRHYIRTRTDSDARNLIYGVNNSDKNLSLDASGHSSSEDIVRLIERMSYGGFSDTLSYVYLPSVSHDRPSEVETKPAKKSYPMNHRIPVTRAVEENPNLGRNSVTKVFDRLHEAEVRHILSLQVEDREPPSHTDASIEIALQGRDSVIGNQKSRPISVETWDWRKPDLSVEVIAFAAPDVVTLNLYWSGNQAILRSWSCPEGIPRLKQLKTVYLHAAPGLETSDRMQRMIQRFQTDVKREAANEQRVIKVEVKLKIKGHLIGLDPRTEGSNWATRKERGHRQHDWIECMEAFKDALKSIHEEFSKEKIKDPDRVKVALIDDGVDLNRLDAYHVRKVDGGTFVDRDVVQSLGLTFCNTDGQVRSPWTSSSRGHGTIMANMILRINPWVLLYSMKLQDDQDEDGRRTIFADSAARAVQGAISRDVHLMSISWSVMNQKDKSMNHTAAPPVANPVESEVRAGKVSAEPSPIGMLEDAIDAVVQKNVIMFCSATDNIQVSGMDCLPYQKAPKHILRIGAATALGQRDPNSEDETTINYFFPGNQVAEKWNPKAEGRVRFHDGASVGTALATGLASLIMYCAILVRTYYEARGISTELRVVQEFDQYVQLLREPVNMNRAFSSIDSDPWKDSRFLPVWDVFGTNTELLKKAKDLDEKIAVLARLVRRLCSKFK